MEQLTYVDTLSLDAHESKIRILVKLEKYEEALQEYDLTIKIYYNEIDKHKSRDQFNEVLDKEESIINLMKGQATLLTNLENYHKANRVYQEILNIDKFDPTVYNKIAEYHEKYGQLLHAIHNYELASQIEPENDYLVEKIEELKAKLQNN